MTTVGNLIDRAYRDYLTVPGEQPPRAKLASNVPARLAGATFQFTVDTAMLSVEEFDLVAPGVVVEIESELVVVESVVDQTVTARGGMFDTAAAAHNNGVYVTVLPEGTPSRKAVFDAVAETIDSLWPDLWAVKSGLFYLGDLPTELPFDCEAVLEVHVSGSWGWEPAGWWTFLSPFPMVPSKRAVQVTDVLYNQAIITYKARPFAPTTESDVIADLNVDESWAKLIVVQAVADTISGVDVEAASAEFITSTLEREGFPVGSSTDLRNALLSYADYLRARRRRALEASASAPSQVTREF